EKKAFSYVPNVSLSTLTLGMGSPCLGSQYHNLQTSPVISVSSCHQASYGLHGDPMASGYYLPPGLRPPLESPRIEITTYTQIPEVEVEEESVDPLTKRVNIVTLTLPSADGYRDPSCLSPASSLSSRSCNSEASYESGFYNYDNSPQNSPWQSPCVSPKGSGPLHSCSHAPVSPSASPHVAAANGDGWARPPRDSRPGSPAGGHGKRKYGLDGGPCRPPLYSPSLSPSASPQGSPRLSCVDEAWLGTTNQYTNSAIVAAINALSTDGLADLGEGVPLKARKTNLEHGPAASMKAEPGADEMGPVSELCQEDYLGSGRLPFKKERYCGSFLDVPPHLCSWTKPKTYISPSLPALDWQLPSCSGPYSLQIEVQPKSHHRAHYETEGSRGAVKALSGGHPVVQLYGYVDSEPLTLQLFIGTADDRLLRPHAFYQVHRITGKTVSTPSHEAMQTSTKVLEIPLLPENNMRAIIDCAGILKLRNSDIELRKGETDIGRKNTRVRMVFRVHINQPNGRTVSLQVASNPIECSQRSAQELPLVEKQSMDTYPATGGKQMLLSGHNFLPDSKVMFVEKAQDGHHVWETEAKVDKDSIKPVSTSLVVEIPPYRSQRIASAVPVSFYVCNSKRKRSQYQCFTYLPPSIPMIKTEPADDYESQGAPRMRSNPYYGQQRLPPTMPLGEAEPCVVGSYVPCPPRPTPLPCSSPGSSPKLHDLSPVPFPGGAAPLPLPSSPDHTSLAMAHPQGSPHLGSPSYHPFYPGSSPSSSPASHPSTPGVAADSPYLPAYGSAQPRGSPPTLLSEDSSSPALAVTIKQEPQELDQMTLDDGRLPSHCCQKRTPLNLARVPRGPFRRTVLHSQAPTSSTRNRGEVSRMISSLGPARPRGLRSQLSTCSRSSAKPSCDATLGNR
uniref:RHD domain-containing protein n=1 Tax=Electrophorus electricus TaxID=8005 RepID=A0AAY5EYE6_ELEEL